MAGTLIAYWPAFRGGFIFDDDVFLTQNHLIHAPNGLWEFWFSGKAQDYWPVTSTSLWIEWRIWGMNAAGYHATNVVLHLANLVLLWILLLRLHVRGAFLAALLWAVHPVNAETVAWITERKNLLACFFFLGALHAWLSSGAMGGERLPSTIRKGLFTASLVLFMAAMLSKSSVVVLPVILAGLVLWRRPLKKQDILRLVPYCFIGLALVLVQARFSTILSAQEMRPLGSLGRMFRASEILWFYLGKTVWPIHLSFDYGALDPAWGSLAGAVSLTLVIVVSGVLLVHRHSWARPALFAWAYFCVCLLPVMGFAEVGFMRYSPVSDHFAHLALVGPLVYVAYWGGGIWGSTGKLVHSLRTVTRIALATAGGSILILLIAGTKTQARDYADGERLYRATLAQNPRSFLCQCNLGVMLLDRGMVLAAEDHLRAAVQLNPQFPDAHNNLGVVCYRLGRLEEARDEYREAIRLRPPYIQAHNNLGVVFAMARQYPQALHEFELAAEIDPDFADVRQNLVHIQQLMAGAGS